MEEGIVGVFVCVCVSVSVLSLSLTLFVTAQSHRPPPPPTTISLPVFHQNRACVATAEGKHPLFELHIIISLGVSKKKKKEERGRGHVCRVKEAL